MPAKQLLLKPCPFCGSKDVHIYGNERDHFYVACCNNVCFCALGELYLPGDEAYHMFFDEESAAYNWNKRTNTKAGANLQTHNTHIAQELREIAAEIDGVADAWQTMDLKGVATRARDWSRQLRNVC